jgi:putative endonuclease
MNYFVYILKCSDQRLYTGCTEGLEERLERHNKGNVPATATRLPIKLIAYTAFENKYKAFEFEKYLKSGSGRAFINRHLI